MVRQTEVCVTFGRQRALTLLHLYFTCVILSQPLITQARKKELTGKVNQAEKMVDSLQKEALGNLKVRMNEVKRGVKVKSNQKGE